MLLPHILADVQMLRVALDEVVEAVLQSAEALFLLLALPDLILFQGSSLRATKRYAVLHLRLLRFLVDLIQRVFEVDLLEDRLEVRWSPDGR